MTFADENQDPEGSPLYKAKTPSEMCANEGDRNDEQQELPLGELTRNKKRIPKCKSSQLQESAKKRFATKLRPSNIDSASYLDSVQMIEEYAYKQQQLESQQPPLRDITNTTGVYTSDVNHLSLMFLPSLSN
jgi:hypothetical protein